MTHSSTPPEEAVTSLPIIASVKESYRLLFSNLWAVPAAVFLPVLIYFLWYLLLHTTGILAVFAGSGRSNPLAGFFLLFLAFAVQAFAMSLLYVAWHRLTLLGPEHGRPRFLYAIRRRHWRFFANALLVLTIVIIAVFLTVLLLTTIMPPAVMAFLVSIVYIALLVKFAFVFPAIAVDENYGLLNAWKQSRGQELRLVAGFVLCFLPAFALYFLVNWDAVVQLATSGQAQITPRPFWLEAFVTVFSLLNGLAVVSYLSIAFKTCSGWVPATPPVPE
ncbi:hypothetical protein [Denitrobaculum tricleocarpae]|uniref:DUF975 family protein n=1 Tax=Denitrobaculum tricleocarpae TaxID=2591009 RepID=A0A545TG47_9PROT|nr:hypothetical protein [Denitrobaculum tricleocarpae]TQV76202.1 hypothetical protein FKG95_21430 [Denitrobaculum tricleocarpae]